MKLSQIQAFLESPDPQSRMKAITELRHHEPDVVVPLLQQSRYDKQFIIRSFVAMGLGYKRNEAGFNTLLDIIDQETDPNVIAEAANSLEKFGDRALPHLVKLFEQNSHWLVRQSIFAALADRECPDIILQLGRLGLKDIDLTVQQAAIATLGRLSHTPQAPAALEILLPLATADAPLVRATVARVLRQFDDASAQSALEQLRQDEDYRVKAAMLDGLLENRSTQ